MALLAVQPITKAGVSDLSAALVAADALGDSVDAASGIFLVFENADASPHTATVAAPVASTDCCNKYGSLPVADIVQTLGVGATVLLAVPLGYASQGAIAWTYDDVTSVSVSAFSIAP